MIKRLYKYLPINNIINWPLIEMEILKPFVNDLINTEQDAKWHGEGNVYNHTKLVCEQLIKLPEYQAKDSISQLILFFSALFHDVGKIVSTKKENEEITVVNHGRKGSNIIRKYLWQEYELSGNIEYQEVREAICLLIKYHMVPLYIASENNIRRTIKLSTNNELTKYFSLEMLYILSKADILGRICSDTDEQLLNLEIFKQIAIGKNTYYHNYQFQNNYTKYHYCNGTNVYEEDSLYDSSWGEIILMCGLPGTGKDTYINNYFKNKNIISLDEIRKEYHIKPTDDQKEVISVANYRMKNYLRSKQEFIWNATNITSLTRQKIISVCHNYNAKVKIIFLETNWQENMKRNQNRQKEVNENIIENLLNKLELPENYEAEVIEWIVI